MPNPPSPTPRARLNWAELIGLPGGGRERAPVVNERRDALARARRPWWLAAQALAALAVVGERWGAVPVHALASWAAAVAGVAALQAVAGGGRRIARREADAVGGLLFGILWAVALTLFAGPAASAPALRLLAAGGALSALGGVVAAPAPLGGLLFTAVAGVAAITAALIDGEPVLALSVLLFAAASLAGLLLGARALADHLLFEATLAEQGEVVSLLLHEFEDTGADWLWRTDASKRLCDVSGRLARQFGLPRAQLENRPLLALLAGEGWDQGLVAPGIRALADRLARRESFRDLTVPVSVNGDQRWWALSATPRRDARGVLTGFIGVGTDVTERHRSAERIDRMARFDALTGLANRAHVIAALGEALVGSHQSGRRSTLMLIDLDRFKQVNDTLGHPVGDRLLVEVSGRLRALAGEGDVCGRLGGDEFAVVVSDADDRDRVEALAETIVSSLSAPYEIDGHRLHIGASVGSATAPRDGRSVETMLRNADLALYQAKDQGRGLHRRYEPQLHAAAERRRDLEISLRAALERGELRLVYQPMVETANGRLAGFEALLRWTHPELGPIAPDTFLPIAEEARLIGRIGDWVMRTACRDAAQWPDDVRVSVNLSAAQLKDPQLPATIIAALSHSGLHPDRLELEIAESVLLQGGDAVGELVDRLLSLGVRISLCDYGTSHATRFLRKGRFSALKIDRAYVRGVAAGAAESVAVVRAVVALADSLGMVAVAEGAETVADVDRMQRLGCGRVQGWRIGGPVDAATAAALALDEPERSAAVA